jgi:aubergine-like protein
VHAEISGRSVLTSHNQMLWRVDFIDWNRSAASTFDVKGKAVSFQQYYLERYKVKIPEAKAGVLVHIPKKKKRDDDEIVLLPEMCHLTGMTDDMKANHSFMQVRCLD